MFQWETGSGRSIGAFCGICCFSIDIEKLYSPCDGNINQKITGNINTLLLYDNLSCFCYFYSDGMDFLNDLGRRITQSTDDHRESAFLFQRLSMLIQRYNAVAVFGTFSHTTPED